MIENEFKIGAIEGNSFSGKTTLARDLRDLHGYRMIEEYDHYAGGGINFPSFPPDNYQEAKKAVNFFIEIERRRTGDALECQVPISLDS